MGSAFKFYKRRFRNALAPLFVMLIHRKRTLGADEWEDQLERTLSRVLSNPSEFLGIKLPDHLTTCDVLYEIFEQFSKEKGYGKRTTERIANMILSFRRSQTLTTSPPASQQ